MLNDAEALEFGQKHVAVWNSHDLEAIVELYTETAELLSPLARALSGGPVIRGRAALREYFTRGFEKYPELTFEIIDTFRCQSSVTLLYYGAGRKRVAEVMFLRNDCKIERVFAHYVCMPPSHST